MNYSGKKKRHTQKTQLVTDRSNRKILCTAFDKGRRHDFKQFKDSKVFLKGTTKCVADTGYQGIQKLHSNSEFPRKKSKKYPLTKADKRQNRSISSIRKNEFNWIIDPLDGTTNFIHGLPI